MGESRCIMHIDMDAFFASIEQLDCPELRGRPVLVGSDSPRGVVAAASYEARPYGCHSAQPMAVAKRCCPHAVVVRPRGRRYREFSARLFAMLEELSPLVEPLSIDEAFVDLTGTRRLLGEPEAVGRRLKTRIREELGLTGSVGLASNKFLAKLASDHEKPNGLTVVPTDGVEAFLAPLPIERLWGVGPVTAQRLHGLGIRTIGDLQRQAFERLRRRLGSAAEHYHRLAHGRDDRPVTPDHAAKSIGHEQTFHEDIAEADEVRRILLEQVEQVGRRLRRHELRANGVSLKIRFGDFQTISRSATLPEPTDTTATLWEAARALFDRWAGEAFSPVRLIGMQATQLAAGGQMGLFEDADEKRRRQLDHTTDAIVERFGAGAIRRGVSLKPDRPKDLRSGFGNPENER